jgi:hypothetical protein
MRPLNRRFPFEIFLLIISIAGFFLVLSPNVRVQGNFLYGAAGFGTGSQPNGFAVADSTLVATYL